MHIIQNIFVCQKLQRGRKFLVGIPEAHNHRKKGKKLQLIGGVALLPLFPAKALAGAAEGHSPAVELTPCSLKEIVPLGQRASLDGGKAGCVHPFMSQAAVLFGIAEHIVNRHGGVIISRIFCLKSIL